MSGLRHEVFCWRAADDKILAHVSGYDETFTAEAYKDHFAWHEDTRGCNFQDMRNVDG